MNEQANKMGRQCAANLESLISFEISAAIGDAWTLPEIAGRLQKVQFTDKPNEIYTLDGKPILEVLPVELETVHEDGKVILRASHQYRTFRVPVNSR